MNTRVQNHIAGRLSLRPPQAESLAKLAQALEAAPELLGHEQNLAATVGTKPWRYLLLPHDEIAESKRLTDFLRYEVKI